ncbi:FMN-binding negative transcriptional regulator [Bacillus thermotolerans]|uniref:Protease synthase and sporulation negative regulatory protein PAI 2 n=1 Tax=Bacillus thermotolerans TaxID=1221996 RepID=A0A0F5HPP1_BACTR|nr:FMN-binding negative transcriptional regulator [Bacillus thermotolerans]KKB35334.1 protease synthase and sporulation negative regulatory protein PAI 2 [Bacillus thermotolerans]
MYIPKHFQLNDEEMINEFIEQYSFATLFSQHNGEPYATHLPLTFNKDEHALYGHFARPNEQWRDTGNQQVLAVFHGPHCYISPSWYETPVAVPTWNYVSVHVYGRLERIEDQEIIVNSLHEMVNKYEKANSSYQLNEVDAKFMEGMTKAIVAFKINITKIEAKAKLSQNHPVERQELVIQQLESSSEHNDLQIASLMKKNLDKSR